ncbi:zinc ribbon domain-containing protein [Allochromatium humboldtianum]|uniref:Zinc ribbon domain-containing protein n=1 Tax=Allochromatium humboldtianum TaxID=504901 RepID=A0A850RLJ6_9GAMM|nr:zinc ribbon domain-containing protein [Allochromatium humboldtianum]NVZ11750.1 zinc ribbon domain-containing protein [Allochromatium humboldtianum]
MPNLKIVICPGCGSEIPLDNRGCPDCGYTNSRAADGRLPTLAFLLEQPSYPEPGAMRLDDVCPAFLRALVLAAH